MQRAVLALCALFLFQGLPAVAQPKATIVGGLSFDFGTLHSTQKVKRLITVRNDGTDTLKITDVSTACGCTAALLSKSALAPGDSGTLQVSFDPRKFTGKVQKPVSMKTNDPKNPQPHITLTATIEKLLEVEPEYLVFKGAPGVPTTEQITIKNLSNAPIDITAVRCAASGVVIGEVPPTVRPGESLSIPVTLTPDRKGAINGDIVVATSHPELAEFPLRFFALVTDPPAAADSGK